MRVDPGFADLGITDIRVLNTLSEIGFKSPTEVQAAVIPEAIEERDLLVQSRTGTGKTASFGLPLVSKLIDPNKKETQALALVPTRELAIQVHAEIERLSSKVGISSAAIYGGSPMKPQTDQLRAGVQFISATPGRILDHIRRQNFSGGKIRRVILDEADEMLSMGFIEDINAILEALPNQRQTMLFSATIPKGIEKLSKLYLKDPRVLLLSEDFVGVHEIEHLLYHVESGSRIDSLLKIIDCENPATALIFCNTKIDTARVTDALSERGFKTEKISSNLSQRDRERVVSKMRAGKIRFLCATDIAARGMDFIGLSHVINYGFPESADAYVHRTGRTGRAGMAGTAISLVSPHEIGALYYLKLIHSIVPQQRHLPSEQEIMTRREGELYAALALRYSDRSPLRTHLDLVDRILSTPDAKRILASALEEILGTQQSGAPKQPGASVVRTRPRRSRRQRHNEIKK